MKTALLLQFNQYGLKSTLPNTTRSSTKESTLIDNIFTNFDFKAQADIFHSQVSMKNCGYNLNNKTIKSVSSSKCKKLY